MKHKKEKQKLHLCSTKSTQESIVEEARIMEDHDLLAKIESDRTVSNVIHYHNRCRLIYTGTANRKKKNSKDSGKTSEWHKTRRGHEKAFELTKLEIDDQILKNEEILRAQDVYQQYLLRLKEFGVDDAVVDEERFKLHHFLEKIKGSYGERVKWTDHPNKAVGKILFKWNMAIEKAFKKRFEEENNLSVDVEELAYAIRKEILHAKRNKLPSNLTVNNNFIKQMKQITSYVIF